VKIDEVVERGGDEGSKFGDERREDSANDGELKKRTRGKRREDDK